MAHIDYFFFTLSPFTYLAGDGLEKIAEKHGATITYKPMALMKVFEATGGPLLRNVMLAVRCIGCRNCLVSQR